jgi:uncharacterized protein (TIGR01777 family)
MKIILPGGSGQVGQILARHLHAAGHQVIVLSRTPKPTLWRTLPWDGHTLDPAWTRALERADAVIHLSGRSVNCRYNTNNRKEIIASRVTPTRLIGHAIQQCDEPPRVWMNASTSTFYRDARDKPQDEFTGELGGAEPGVPDTWNFSIDVARRWEDAFYACKTPTTRKIALRSSMTMSPDPGGVFSVLLGLVRFGLGGTQGPGDQYVSWIHDADYVRAIDFLLRHEDICGPVNLTSPNPLLNKDFLAYLRKAWGVPFGLPAPGWMLELGAVILRTETELILKSRRAVPTVLLQNGFTFDFPTWPEAVEDLVARTREAQAPQPLPEDG